MQDSYVEIMVQSLKKKIQVLNQIIELNELQKKELEGDEGSAEAFDSLVEQKSKLIEQLELLDSGFDKLFARVRDLLKEKPEEYVDSVRLLQSCIRRITDQSMQIQVQEARNKELMTLKFTRVKTQARSLRANSKVTTQYYKNMMQLNYVAPQFMDNKK